MAASVRRTVSHSARARIFRALSRALESGIPTARAFALAAEGLDPDLAKRLARAGSAAGKGRGLAASLDRAGLLGVIESAELGTAETAGRLAPVLGAAADRAERADARARRVRGRLLLPLFVLVLALAIAPLPALIAGTIGAGGYVARVLVPLAVLAVAWLAARSLWRRWSSAGMPSGVAVVAGKLPLAGSLLERARRAAALDGLHALAVSGLPAVDALRVCESAPGAGATSFAVARRALERGAGVADALDEAGLLDQAGYAALSTGEAAGRLDEALGRLAAHERQGFDDAVDQLAQWTPRVAYALVAGWIAAGILA